MEKFGKMGLGDTIDGKTVFSPEIDKIGHTEDAELLGHKWLRKAEPFRQLAHICISIAELGDDHESRRIRKRLEDIGYPGSS